MSIHFVQKCPDKCQDFLVGWGNTFYPALLSPKPVLLVALGASLDFDQVSESPSLLLYLEISGVMA